MNFLLLEAEGRVPGAVGGFAGGGFVQEIEGHGGITGFLGLSAFLSGTMSFH